MNCGVQNFHSHCCHSWNSSRNEYSAINTEHVLKSGKLWFGRIQASVSFLAHRTTCVGLKQVITCHSGIEEYLSSSSGPIQPTESRMDPHGKKNKDEYEPAGYVLLEQERAIQRSFLLDLSTNSRASPNCLD